MHKARKFSPKGKDKERNIGIKNADVVHSRDQGVKEGKHVILNIFDCFGMIDINLYSHCVYQMRSNKQHV